MYLRLFHLLVIIKLTTARYALAPNIITENSAITADENKQLTPHISHSPARTHYRRIQAYPFYQLKTVATNSKHATPTTSTTTEPPSSSTTTESSSSSTTNTITTTTVKATASTIYGVGKGTTPYTPEEFPHDLLMIARHKLGLRTLDEIPSISELADFLGTSNADETIKYIRQLTNTEQGIALIKAYLESADYTDRTDEERRKQATHTQANSAAVFEPEQITAKPKVGMLERIAAYFHIYNLWPQAEAGGNKNVAHVSKLLQPQLRRIQQSANLNAQRPTLANKPLPYHYPIPLRPLFDNKATKSQHRLPFAPQSPSNGHLNTPKVFVPPHVQLARVTNIPPKQLQHLLQTKPKLAELAAKFSHLPLTNDRASRMDAQLLAAVQRAIEQDDDLKKLLASMATLK